MKSCARCSESRRARLGRLWRSDSDFGYFHCCKQISIKYLLCALCWSSGQITSLEKQQDWVHRHYGELLQRCPCIYVRARACAHTTISDTAENAHQVLRVNKMENNRGGMEAGAVLSREGKCEQKEICWRLWLVAVLRLEGPSGQEGNTEPWLSR